MNAAEQAERFCSVLFADLGGALDGHDTAVWSSRDRVTRWLPVNDPAAIAATIRGADQEPGAEAVYIAMALSPRGLPLRRRNDDGTTPNPRKLRPLNTEIGAMVAVWADVDLAGPVHAKPGLPQTEAEALRILRSTGLAPTMIWRTGHGLQACWCLAEPEVFEPDSPEYLAAATVMRNWNTTLAVHAHRLGRYTVDRVHDLTRILRAPGTTNRKLPDDLRRVELIEVNDSARYELADLVEHTVDQVYLDRFTGMTARPGDGGTGAVDLKAVWELTGSREYRERRFEPEWLTELVAAGVMSETTTLVHVFRKGHASGDPSTRDASLARCIADVRADGGDGMERVFDERDAAELIMCARRRDGDKLDKVDPARRTSYLVTTIDKVFGQSDIKFAEVQARRSAGDAALAAQDAVAERAPMPVLPAAPQPQTPPDQTPHIPRDLGAEIVADLDRHSANVVPDPDGSAWDVPADAPAPPRDDPEAAELLAEMDAERELGQQGPTEPVVDEPAPRVDAPTDDPEPEPDAAADGAPAPTPALEAGEPEPEPDTEESPIRPLPSPWGTRTESQHAELTALSASLLGPRAEHIQLWRGQYRGRGQDQRRRVLARFAENYRWPGQPPEGYVPGALVATGWWPAAAFNTLGGWIKALRQDLLIVTAPMTTEEFNARFADTLVRIWEPDDSGGSLASVTRRALESYLLDYPPSPSWGEATAQGMPYIMQGTPRWQLDTAFTVLVRWASFARHVRTHFAVNVTPAIAAEMAEVCGAVAMPTSTQDGQWYRVRREYLGDATWASVLGGAQAAEMRREEKHGLHIVGQDPPRRRESDLGPTHRAAPGAGR